MLELQKIFLIVRFFTRICCNKGLKTKISCFFSCFFCLAPLRLKSSRIRKIASFLTSYRVKKYTNWRRSKRWKSQLFEGKLRVFIRVKWKQSVCSIVLLHSIIFYRLFLPFFVLEIFNFKYDKFFVKHSASILNLNDLNSRDILNRWRNPLILSVTKVICRCQPSLKEETFLSLFFLCFCFLRGFF